MFCIVLLLLSDKCNSLDALRESIRERHSQRIGGMIGTVRLAIFPISRIRRENLQSLDQVFAAVIDIHGWSLAFEMLALGIIETLFQDRPSIDAPSLSRRFEFDAVVGEFIGERSALVSVLSIDGIINATAPGSFPIGEHLFDALAKLSDSRAVAAIQVTRNRRRKLVENDRVAPDVILAIR